MYHHQSHLYPQKIRLKWSYLVTWWSVDLSAVTGVRDGSYLPVKSLFILGAIWQVFVPYIACSNLSWRQRYDRIRNRIDSFRSTIFWMHLSMTFNHNGNTQVLHRPLMGGIPLMQTMSIELIPLKSLLQTEHFCFVHPAKMTKSNGWELSEHWLLAEQALVWFLGEPNFHPQIRHPRAWPQSGRRLVLVLRSKAKCGGWAVLDQTLSVFLILNRKCVRQRHHKH